jgi:hypothetical protein
MPDQLQDFIRHARGKGLDHGTIRLLLVGAGWKEKEIVGAMASEGLDAPVPEPAGARGARDAFLYLLTFTALYITVSSVIVLYYTYLNYLYPDPAWNDWSAEMAVSTVRYAISAVLIAFPLFVLFTVMFDRVGRGGDAGQIHPTRRWLTYLTLFLAAAVSLGDVITLLYFFLDGSLTTRFVMKVVVLFVIFQVVLSYYFLAPGPLQNARKTAGSFLHLRRFLAATAIVLVTGAVVLGFSLAGSPATARLQRLDDKRVEDLRAVHRTIQKMVTKRENGTLKVIRALPKSLDEVAKYQQTQQGGRRLELRDPQTGEEYAYAATGEKTYELSARFDLLRERETDLFWNHAAGKQTFSFKAESPP